MKLKVAEYVTVITKMSFAQRKTKEYMSLYKFYEKISLNLQKHKTNVWKRITLLTPKEDFA